MRWRSEPCRRPSSTLIFPVVAPVGTTAVDVVPQPLENVVAETPLNFTAVIPLSPIPESVTVPPTGPCAGEKLVIDNVGLKLEALGAETPSFVLTVILPTAAPSGTLAVTFFVARLYVTDGDAFEPNMTVFVYRRLVPEMATLLPVMPLAG